jgi:leucyl/phenylalanyl-tRNA--protein transferase
LKKRLKKGEYCVSIDCAFVRVLDGCAAPRPGDCGTWLSPAMRRAYTSLHNAGLAHSIEVWMDGELAGGVYGVAIGRMFFGESMFAQRTDASKIGIVVLAQQLARWRFPFNDCPLETAHLLSLGAEHLPRRKFIAEIAQLVKERAPSWRLDADLAGSLAHLPRVLRPGVDARP